MIRVERSRTLQDIIDTLHEVYQAPSSAAKFPRLPVQVLRTIGQNIVNAGWGDGVGNAYRERQVIIGALNTLTYSYAYSGACRVSCFIAATVFGREDLRDNFDGPDIINPERALHWFIQYGVEEHRLWAHVDQSLRKMISTSSIPTCFGHFSPLEMTFLRDRPDVRRAVAEKKISRGDLWQWVMKHGINDHHMGHLLNHFAIVEGAHNLGHSQITRDERRKIDTIIIDREEVLISNLGALEQDRRGWSMGPVSEIVCHEPLDFLIIRFGSEGNISTRHVDGEVVSRGAACTEYSAPGLSLRVPFRVRFRTILIVIKFENRDFATTYSVLVDGVVVDTFFPVDYAGRPYKLLCTMGRPRQEVEISVSCSQIDDDTAPSSVAVRELQVVPL